MMYYFFAMINDFKIFSLTIAGLLAFAGGIGLLAHYVEDADTVKPCKRFLKIALFLYFLCVAMPNQKQLAFIVAAPAIVNNEDVQGVVKDIPAIMKLGTEYLKETLENVNSSNRLNDSNVSDNVPTVEH